MNFLRKESGDTKTIYQILEDYGQTKLRAKLIWNNQVSPEVINDSAYVTVKDKIYVNHTYAFMTNLLEEIPAALDMLVKSFVEEVGDNLVSFRQPIIIERQDNKYFIYMRAAIVDRV